MSLKQACINYFQDTVLETWPPFKSAGPSNSMRFTATMWSFSMTTRWPSGETVSARPSASAAVQSPSMKKCTSASPRLPVVGAGFYGLDLRTLTQGQWGVRIYPGMHAPTWQTNKAAGPRLWGSDMRPLIIFFISTSPVTATLCTALMERKWDFFLLVYPRYLHYGLFWIFMAIPLALSLLIKVRIFYLFYHFIFKSDIVGHKLLFLYQKIQVFTSFLCYFVSQLKIHI